jgi:hypothetical protein
MRCLYCGNELALFKKLTGGGEFCSEAHRQKYQDEYNRLALSRLLQAQSYSDNRPSAQPVSPLKSKGAAVASPPPQSPRPAQPEAPPESGFLVSRFEPALSPRELFSDEPFLSPVTALLPGDGMSWTHGGLAAPGPVRYPVLETGWENILKVPEAIEPREFNRAAPVMQISLENFRRNSIQRVEERFGIPLGRAPRRSGRSQPATARQFSPAISAPRIDLSTVPLGEDEIPGPAWTQAEDREVALHRSSPVRSVYEFEAVAIAIEGLPLPSDPAPAVGKARQNAVVVEPSPEIALADLPSAPAPDASARAEAEEHPAEIAASGEAPHGPIPRAAETPLRVGIAPLAPEPAARISTESMVPIGGARPEIPMFTGIPIRAKMAFGPAPETAKQPAEAASAEAGKPTPAADVPVEPPAARAPEVKAAEPVKPPSPPAKPAETAPAQPVAKPQTKAPESPAPLAEPDFGRKHGARPTLDLDGLRLELEHSEISSPLGAAWKRMSGSKRAVLMLSFVLSMVIAGYLLRGAFAAKAPSAAPPAAPVESVGASLMVGEGGWAADWSGPGQGALAGRRISIYLPSLPLSDYRIEFQGQIESKSLGWVFRAANPHNYYALKLETIKPGLNPTVALVRSVVLNGVETEGLKIPLPFPVRIETTYRVRTDVLGSTFKTYVQDQLVDTWKDDRLPIGGFGLLTDRGERAEVQSVQLYALTSTPGSRK